LDEDFEFMTGINGRLDEDFEFMTGIAVEREKTDEWLSAEGPWGGDTWETSRDQNRGIQGH
jgi:hypothetical protein